jgi:hypothetical protein
MTAILFYRHDTKSANMQTLYVMNDSSRQVHE